MSKMVTIYIDGQDYTVPAGTNLVDVAKFYADNDIPVFCYHPKMEPVGMCRMCLVEMGFIQRDRETGEVLQDENGNPSIRWFPRLQTACTQIVSDGMVIRTQTDQVSEARDDIIEFILTSHPLDCPICDKGGECPLQNLTMRHGAGTSRFDFNDKLKLAKHVPLGDLIYLDRERCIQCARCTRYCDEVVGDAVLGFHQRGRSLQIVTNSDPGFDSYWSGNTTDICPVGALTTADFRFGARPWELKEVPSLDPYGPEGANISLSTRLDREAGGIVIIKRVMPRQNEYVNEIWISDKTRFGHHYTRSEDRLHNPLIRRDGELIESTWDEALNLIAEKLSGDSSVGAIAGPALSNEDLWELHNLLETAGGGEKGLYPAIMTGADVVEQVGLASGSNFSPFFDATSGNLVQGMGSDTVILIVASDLEEEAPIWWLRAKQAHDRGATIITLNARDTSIDFKQEIPWVREENRLRYDYGDAAGAVNNLVAKAINSDLVNEDFLKRVESFADLKKAVKGERARNGFADPAEAIAKAENLVVICGGEGVNLDDHRELMQACANLLIVTGHAGRPNNGLIPVWPGANIQGAFDFGYHPEATVKMAEKAPDVLFIAGCNPAGEATELSGLKEAGFVVVTSLFETETTAFADVILPQQSFAEREGTFTSGERRVQRFYAAQGVIGESLPDWKIFAEIRRRMDGTRPKISVPMVMAEITKSVEKYAGAGYKNLAMTENQFPDVGGDDLYYGGTAYQNTGGVGVQYPVAAENEDIKLKVAPVKTDTTAVKGLRLIPTTRLYDREMRFVRSELMHPRIPEPVAFFNLEDANSHTLQVGDRIMVTVGSDQFKVRVMIDGAVPAGSVLVPRRMNAVPTPFTPVGIDKIEKVVEAQELAVTEG